MEQVAVRNHQTARQNSQAAVQNAHVDVQLKRRYTLTLKKGGCEGDDRRVCRAQKLFHVQDLTAACHKSRAFWGQHGTG